MVIYTIYNLLFIPNIIHSVIRNYLDLPIKIHIYIYNSPSSSYLWSTGY